ncbi:23S rRNA (uracil-5-)-methyltransferase RumA, partial [Escherichia coli]|nr:23S rRNA (uracil-5-)-methyltransferase RumA [Escherichia coli]
KRSHAIIDMSTCLIHNEQGDFAVQKTREILAKYGTEPYDEQTGKGDIRHIMTRFAHTTGQLMIVLVTTKERMPFKEEIVRDLV